MKIVKMQLFGLETLLPGLRNVATVSRFPNSDKKSLHDLHEFVS